MPFPPEGEAALRLASFVAVFALIALWEAAAPRRGRAFARRARWPHNLGLAALDAALLRLAAPGAAIAVAAAAEERGWGLLNALALPGWLAVLAAVVLLDAAIRARHVVFHAVPALRRLHRVHHSIAYNETNSNFGFNLPWWDRLFGTYRAQPAAGHERMTIGVDAFRTSEDLPLDRLLAQPLRDTAGGYAIHRRAERGGEEARHA